MRVDELLLMVAVIVAVAAQGQQIYSNLQAYRCFQEKAVQQCSQQLERCMKIPSCHNQMERFGGCSFHDSDQQSTQIFNGYCFRRWFDRAQLSRQLILCMATTCNLFYNSQIGTKQLFQCSQWVLLSNDIECEDECSKEMVQKVRDKTYTKTVSEIYGQIFENEQAAQFAKLIFNECVLDDGSGKKMIYEQEKIKDQRVKQKIEKAKRTKNSDRPQTNQAQQFQKQQL